MILVFCTGLSSSTASRSIPVMDQLELRPHPLSRLCDLDDIDELEKYDTHRIWNEAIEYSVR